MTPREDLSFRSGADTCAAWWYPVIAADQPVPIVVMAHGLTGTRRDRLGAFAERFAAAGFAALVFDHRGFGDSGGEPDRFVPARQLDDWRAAIEFARTLSGVDPDRVVTFGSSMGGGNALAAAAGDRRVAAAISQVPFLDIVTQSYRTSPHVTQRMLEAAARGRHLPGRRASQTRRRSSTPPTVKPAGGASSRCGEDSRWRNRVCARWLLGRPFRPVRHAKTLHCPWLVCVGEADQVAAPGPAIACRAARPAW